jgi:hypothetical protein
LPHSGYLKVSSPHGIAVPQLDAKFRLAPGTVEFTSSSAEDPAAVSWRLSPDLSAFHSTLNFNPLPQGNFVVSTTFPIGILNPALRYGSSTQSLELTLAPEYRLKSAEITANAVLTRSNLPSGSISVKSKSTALSVTASGKDQVIGAAVFQSLPTIGLLDNVSVGISGDFPQGRSFRSISLYAKAKLKSFTFSAIGQAQAVALTTPNLEFRLQQTSRYPWALLCRRSAGNALEVAGAGAFDLGGTGARLSFRADSAGSVGIALGCPRNLSPGVETTLSASYTVGNPWQVGLKLVVDGNGESP